jgi:putative adenylate-forming enzyme
MPIDSSSGLPTLDPGELRAQVLELVARHSWSREELLRYQATHLREALTRAVADSDYYRETIGDLVARDATLAALPILTKRLLMDNFDRVVTDHRLSRTLIERHLDGTRPGDLLLGKYRTAATGGTTGERGIFVYDEAAWLSAIANIGRFQHVLGVGSTTRSVGIAAASPIHLSTRFQAELRAVRPGSPRLDLTMPVAEVAAALNAYQPEAIVTYPSFIRVLAEEQLAGRLRIAPRVVRSGAETLTAPVRELARTAWQVPVIDSYACTEVGPMGQECGHVRGIHLAEDLCVFENVDEDGRPVADGEPGAKLLVTTLANRTLPLVRYELTDMVALTSEPCGCGLPFARIHAIEGRKEEVLQFPGRHGGAISVHAGRLRPPLLRTAGVRQVQFVPFATGLDVLIVVEPGHDPDATCSRAEKAVRNTLDDLGTATSVRARAVAQIMRTGAGAKEKLIGVPRQA